MHERRWSGLAVVGLCGAALVACGVSLEALEATAVEADGSSSGTSASSSGGSTSRSGEPGSSSSGGAPNGSSGAPVGDAAVDATIDAGAEAGNDDASTDAGPPPVCEPIDTLPLCDGFSSCVGDAEVASGRDNVRLTGKDRRERGALWMRRTIDRRHAFTLQIDGSIDQDDENVGHGLAVAFVQRTDGGDGFPGIANGSGSTLGLASGSVFDDFSGGAGYLRTVSNPSSPSKTGQLVLGRTAIPTQSSSRVDGFDEANGDAATPTFDRNVLLRYRIVVSHAANAPTASLRLHYVVGSGEPPAYVDLAQSIEVDLPERTDFVGVSASNANDTRSRHRVRGVSLRCD